MRFDENIYNSIGEHLTFKIVGKPLICSVQIMGNKLLSWYAKYLESFCISVHHDTTYCSIQLRPRKPFQSNAQLLCSLATIVLTIKFNLATYTAYAEFSRQQR